MTESLPKQQVSPFANRWEKYSRGCALLALIIGGTGFAGWIFDKDALTRVHPSLVSMKFNTAVCLMVAACSLFLLQNENVSACRRRCAQAGGIFITLVGMLTLVEILFQVNLGIDECFFRETAERAGRSVPGRMGFASTLIFMSLGTALFFLPKKSRVSSVCALFAGLVTLLIFLIYFFGVEAAQAILYLTIALHTVVAFIALSAGILMARPGNGVLKPIFGNTIGGRIARRMLPGAVLLPIFLGWLRTIGRNAGWFSQGFGTAAFVTLIILAFIGLIWWTLQAINQEESERKEAEAVLRAEQHRTEKILSSITDAFITLDIEWHLTYINARAAEIFEKLSVPADVLGRNYWEIFPTTVGTTLDQEYHRALRDQVAVHLENFFSPTQSWLEISAYPSDSGLSIFFRDITHRKTMEEALRESEERFRTMADNIAPLAWMANPDGHIFFYNRRWYEYTGTTLEEMQGWGWEKVHHPEELQRMLPNWKNALATGQPWEDIFPLRHHGGEYGWFLSRAFPIRDASGKIIRWFGTNIDITELRKTQEELRQAQIELQEHAATLEQKVKERTIELKETNEQLEAFVYSIAHDLRAPLRAMQGFSQILMDDYAPSLNETARQYLERINGSSAFMDKMIMDLLAFGRAGHTETQLDPVQVEVAWSTAVYQYARQIEQTDTQIETVQPLPTVLAHEATLAQVLANLLSNAIKFIPKDIQPKIRLWSEDRGETVRLWVQDNGVGIPAEQHERVFRVFERLHGARFPGTGIGLSIVRKGVERMGGQIGLESRPGEGSKFWLELRKA